MQKLQSIDNALKTLNEGIITSYSAAESLFALKVGYAKQLQSIKSTPKIRLDNKDVPFLEIFYAVFCNKEGEYEISEALCVGIEYDWSNAIYPDFRVNSSNCVKCVGMKSCSANYGYQYTYVLRDMKKYKADELVGVFSTQEAAERELARLTKVFEK